MRHPPDYEILEGTQTRPLAFNIVRTAPSRRLSDRVGLVPENQKSKSRRRIGTLLRGSAILLMILMSSVWSGVVAHVGATYGLPRLVVASLALRGPVDPPDLSGRTPLVVASRDGRLAVVELLLRHGADADLALHVAVEKLWVEIVSALLAGGADPNLASQSGASALRTALGRSDVQAGAEIAALLLRAGADPARADRGSSSGLALAARTSPLRLVRDLLDAGADPSPPGDWTPVKVAVEQERPDVAELLLEAGANPNSEGGWTTLFWAARNEDLASAELLLAFGADPNVDLPSPTPALFEAVRKEHVEMVRLLLEHEANPNVFTPLSTLLGSAIGSGNERIARLLMEAGADPNGSSEARRTPLEDAVQDDNVEMVRLLMEAGADPNGPPEAGRTPLEHALRYADPSILGSLAGLLLDAGASVGEDVLDSATRIILSREMGPADQERFAAVTRLVFGRGAIETYVAHTRDDVTRWEWRFPEFDPNRLFQIWLYARNGRPPYAIELFDYYFVQATASARTARAHLVLGNLLGEYPRYQALLEEAGIN